MKQFFKKIFCCFSKQEKIKCKIEEEISPFHYIIQVNGKEFHYKNHRLIHNVSFSNSTSSKNSNY